MLSLVKNDSICALRMWSNKAVVFEHRGLIIHVVSSIEVYSSGVIL